MNHLDVIHYLSDPQPHDVTELLRELWNESTPEHADDEYVLQWRILSAILNKDVARGYVIEAMEACNSIALMERGVDVKLLYGMDNNDENRERLLDAEHQNLSIAARNIGGGK